MPQMSRIARIPNEILTEVAEWLYAVDPANNHKFSDFRPLQVFSQVSRRFRLVALPLLWRRLEFTSAARFDAFVEHVQMNDRSAQLAPCTQILRIAIPADGVLHYGFPPLILTPHTTRHFSGLVTFQCVQLCSSLATLEALSACPNLQRLDFLWEDAAEWPALELLPRLRTVCMVGTMSYLRAHPDDAVCLLPQGHREVLPYSAITTFSLRVPFYSALLAQCLAHLNLPQLREFSVDTICGPPHGIFWFVHRHPTLLEVSVGARASTRLEAVLKLAERDGVWSPGQGRLNKEIRTEEVDFDTYYEAKLPPSLVQGLHVGTSHYTFSRVPISALKDGSAASTLRYKCTALAMRIREAVGAEETGTGRWSNYTSIINSLLRRAPYLEELRVLSPTETDLDAESLFDVSTFMDVIAQTADGQTAHHLRRLAIYWSDGFCNNARWTTKLGGQYIPILDFVGPPFAFGSRGSSPRTRTVSLREIHKFLPHGFDLDSFEVAVQRVLHLSDEELDRDDDSLLMRAWAVRNKDLVAGLVREIANRHRALEGFEWWVKAYTWEGSVRWRWVIKRDADGDVASVQGTLTWTGCLLGSPQVLPSFVGEKMQHIFDTSV